MVGEWQKVPLFDVADVFFGYPFDSRYFNSEGLGIPLIRIRNLQASEACLFTTEIGYPESVQVEPGDLLVGMDAEFRPHRWSGSKAVLNQRVCKIVPKSGHWLDREFLRFALRSPLKEIESAKTGTTVIHLNKTDMERMKVLWPPRDYRHAIAHILGTLDDKIELNRRMSETLEAMARALFKAWFVDFEPVRAKMEGRWQRGQSLPGLPAHLYDLFPDRLVESELGEIPEGWRVGRLGDLAEVTSGKRPNRVYPEPQPYASIPLWGGNGPMGYVTEPLYSTPILLTGRVGTLGSVFRIATPCWPSDNTLVVIAREKVAIEFLYFQMKRFDYDALNRGSTQPLLTQTDLSGQQVALPSNRLLSEFHKHVSTYFAKLDESMNESRTLAALRDALLPKLIRGEIRVKDAERFLKERGL
jgi:type I restriction enzyme S subunit